MQQFPEDDDRRDDAAPRRRRRFSIWTVLAPVGALVFIIALVSSYNASCLGKGDCKEKKDDAVDTGKPANDIASGKKAKVTAGQSMGSIAARFNLSVAELQACNPLVDAQTLQPGQFLNVSAIDCEGQDLAAAGANPDPLADDTAAVDPSAKAEKAAVNNGTATADPSAKAATSGKAAATDDAAADTDAGADQ